MKLGKSHSGLACVSVVALLACCVAQEGDLSVGLLGALEVVACCLKRFHTVSEQEVDDAKDEADDCDDIGRPSEAEICSDS